MHHGRLYVLVIGENDGKNVAVVLKDGGDCKTSKNFIENQLKPYNVKVVYTNCD